MELRPTRIAVNIDRPPLISSIVSSIRATSEIRSSPSVETYRSQRIYIVGEVRSPGAYPLSGDIRLVEALALALAGSTLPTASGEAVIVHQSDQSIVVDPAAAAASDGSQDPDKVQRVDLRGPGLSTARNKTSGRT